MGFVEMIFTIIEKVVVVVTASYQPDQLTVNLMSCNRLQMFFAHIFGEMFLAMLSRNQ